MLLRKFKLLFVSLSLALSSGISNLISKSSLNSNGFEDSITRTIQVEEGSFDYKNALDEFENGRLETKNNLTKFEGFKTFNLSDFSDIDYVSDDNVGEEFIEVKFNFSFDSNTGNVTLSAKSTDGNGLIEIEEIHGFAFYDKNNEIDACLDVDGSVVLLSEMRNLGLIENCGLFSKIIKAAVAVVAVAAVAAVCVASCGAALPAVIAAGAIAGGIAGAVAGGVISYSEYGKLDWKWIAGGAVIGAALGAATGWGVGTLMGCSTGSASYLSKDFNFSNTVLNHTDRPYRGSQLLAKEIMKAGNPVADPGGIVGGLKWVVPGSFNGTLGTWELVYDVSKNMIVHFLFVA